MGADVKGDIYEGLLAKSAAESPKGAGQYFTPRALIQAMVDCIAPQPGERITDPACGTGGFLFTAHNYITSHNKSLTREQLKHLKEKAFTGYELVQGTARVCAMNMMLHGIGSEKQVPVVVGDALAADPGERFEVVLANPPFGKKSSMTFTNDEGEEEKDDLVYNRQDFWATSSNKQLNFLQHIRTMLKTTGQAAVVLPDNVLFEGGVGETVRKKLLENTDLHTILRLPTGIFYAQGVKTNVLFFTRGANDKGNTKEVWVYDLRAKLDALYFILYGVFDPANAAASRDDLRRAHRIGMIPAARVADRRNVIDVHAQSEHIGAETASHGLARLPGFTASLPASSGGSSAGS